MKNALQFICLLTLVIFSSCDTDSASFFEGQNGSSGSITRFATLGDFMYTLNPNQIQTFDISEASNPVLVSELETDYGLETIFIYNDKVYLGSRTGLYILGLDNPAAPNILSQTFRTDDFFGACDPVVVKDNYAYSTVKTIVNVCGNLNTRSALLVYEVSNPENPVLNQTFDLSSPNGLAYTDQFLYVCDTGSELLRVFDISDPSNVEERRDLDYALQDPFDIIVDGDRMIVSTLTNFGIFSVANGGAITYIKSIAK